jgi:hypothetical protein
MRKNGIQYQEAENGLEALQQYQEGKRKFDVILMGEFPCYRAIAQPRQSYFNWDYLVGR